MKERNVFIFPFGYKSYELSANYEFESNAFKVFNNNSNFLFFDRDYEKTPNYEIFIT